MTGTIYKSLIISSIFLLYTKIGFSSQQDESVVYSSKPILAYQLNNFPNEKDIKNSKRILSNSNNLDIYENKEISISCVPGNNYKYLDGNGNNVNIERDKPLINHSGTTWKLIKNTTNDYSLQFMTPDSKDKYLDGYIRDNEVHISSSTNPVGTHWEIFENRADDYSFKCIPTSDMYLDGYIRTGDVHLSTSGVPPSDTPIGIHWHLELLELTSGEFFNIIKNKFPSINLNSYFPADAKFQTLRSDTVESIWQDSGLGKKYKWKDSQFDCDDFAVCLKAEVSKWMYNQDQTYTSPKGAAFGILCRAFA